MQSPAQAPPQDEFYSVRSAPYSFVAHTVRDEESHRLRVQFGGHRPCVMADVYDGDPLAHFTGVRTHPRCCLSGAAAAQAQAQARSADTQARMNARTHAHTNASTSTSVHALQGRVLQVGQGTVRMIRAAARFLLWRCPELQGITFRDTSHIDSKAVPGLKVPLPSFYAAKHGRTWYMAHVGAAPLNGALLEPLLTGCAAVHGSPLRPRDFDAFFKEHIDLHVRHMPAVRRLIARALRPHFDASATLGELVQRASEELDCAVFAEWLHAYVCERVPPLAQTTAGLWLIPAAAASAWTAPVIAPMPAARAEAERALAEPQTPPRAPSPPAGRMRPGREDPLFWGLDNVDTPEESPSSSSQDGGGGPLRRRPRCAGEHHAYRSRLRPRSSLDPVRPPK